MRLIIQERTGCRIPVSGAVRTGGGKGKKQAKQNGGQEQGQDAFFHGGILLTYIFRTNRLSERIRFIS
jgi:hypothetical protein